MIIKGARIASVGTMSLRNTYDGDALAYLNAVEAADGQALETPVKAAINTFVVGCKFDGIWTSLTNACIMAGARSVAGAIVPLRGNAPANVGFVSGDYSRKTGLLGDASSKYLTTAYFNSNFPTDNVHISCYVTQAPSLGANIQMFIGQSTGSGGRLWLRCLTTGTLSYKNRILPTGGATIPNEGTTIGFKGHSRSSSNNTILRTSQSNTTNTTNSTSIIDGAIGVFHDGNSSQFSNARMSFYSLGTNIDLALLDTRITTLMTTLGNIL